MIWSTPAVRFSWSHGTWLLLCSRSVVSSASPRLRPRSRAIRLMDSVVLLVKMIWSDHRADKIRDLLPGFVDLDRYLGGQPVHAPPAAGRVIVVIGIHGLDDLAGPQALACRVEVDGLLVSLGKYWEIALIFSMSIGPVNQDELISIVFWVKPRAFERKPRLDTGPIYSRSIERQPTGKRRVSTRAMRSAPP